MRAVTKNEGTPKNFLLYGPAGSGKSFSLRTLAGKVLIVQTEPGIVSALEDPAFRARVEAGEAVVLQAETWADVSPLRLGLQPFLQAAKLADFKPDAVALDSITWLAELAKEDIMRSYPSKTGLPEIQQWQLITENTKLVVRSLLRAPVTCILIAQADCRDVEEPTGTTTMWVPGMPGRYSTRIAHDIDVVLFSRRTLDGSFVADTAASGAKIAKVRGKELPKTVPLDFSEILRLLEG